MVLHRGAPNVHGQIGVSEDGEMLTFNFDVASGSASAEDLGAGDASCRITVTATLQPKGQVLTWNQERFYKRIARTTKSAPPRI